MNLPPLHLEQLALGEARPDQARATLERLGDASERRLEDLRADDAAILRRYPPRVVAIEIARRRRVAQIWRWSPLLAGGTVAVAAALLTVGPALPPSADPGAPVWTEDGVRLKGAATLLVHRRTVDGEQRLPEGAPARAGDQLQLEIQPAQADHAVLYSLDGRGNVTRHLPLAGASAAPVDPGRRVALPNAYQLDDAPAFERFFLVVGRGSFDVATVERAVSALAARPDRGRTGDLALPAHLAADSHLIVKDTP